MREPADADAMGRPAGPTKVLILDDDAQYGDTLAAYLAEHGMQARAFTQPAQMEEAVRDVRPDILLLDQRLGETTGTEMLVRIRAGSDMPCIIVTGFSDATDRIINLELGADDEVSKSTSPRELLARIRTVLRRHARAPRLPAATPPQASGGWVFSPERRLLLRPGGERCHLTTAEYETFRLLHEAAGQPLSRHRLSLAVFQRSFDPSDRAVDTVIRKLRRKLDDWPDPQVIKTVRPMGYVFTGFP